MIVLQFVRGTDFGARAIEWFSHCGDFSHVDTVLPEGLLGSRSDTTGGKPPGVQIRDPSYVGAERTLRVEIPASPGMTQRYVDFLRSQLGKPYDVDGILGFIVGRDWRNPVDWFCSELVTAGLEQSGYFPFALSSPSNKITPADLVLLLSRDIPIQLH